MGKPSTSDASWLTMTNLVWLVIYLLAMGSIVGGLNYARTTSLAKFNSPAAQADWNEFRTEMDRQSKDMTAPVARRAPKSEEPPTMRLLRDYFGTCVLISLMLSSALFITFMVMLRGVFGGERFTPRQE